METKQINANVSLHIINDASELKALVNKFKGMDKVDLASIVILPANKNFNVVVKRFQVLETAKAKAIQIIGDATSETGEVFKGISATCDLDSLPTIGSTCTIQTSTYEVEGKDGKNVQRVKAIVTKVSTAYTIASANAAPETKSETINTVI